MANCFTKAQIKKWGLEGLSEDDQIRKVRDILGNKDNTKRQIKMQAIIIAKELRKIRQHPKGSVAGLKAELYTDRWEMSQTSGVEANIHAIRARYQSKLYSIMEEYMPRKLGLDINKKGQLDLLKVARGEEPSNPSLKKMGEAWAEVKEELRVRANRAGNNINKLENHGITMHHDPYLVKKADFEEWFNDIKEGLDFDRMGISETSSRNIFIDIFHNISSDGMYSAEPGKFRGRMKVANRHKQARFFHFKDAEAQMKYMDKYTDTSIYSAMMDYVGMMSQEIGLMEKFGPNPDSGIKTLIDHVNIDERNKNAGDFIEKAYANISGKTNPLNRKFADRAQTLRNIETGVHLGGATLSALPDVMFNAMTSKYNGLPGMKVLTKFIKNLSHLNAEDRKLAAQLWMPLDFMLDEAHSAMRFADVAGHKASSRFAGFVMRGSGLNAWTIAGKMAFHTEFMAELAKTDWHPNTLRTFKRYGITESDISAIKQSVKLVKNGVEYLDPTTLPQDTAERIISMVTSETKYAVPEGDLLVRTVMNQGTRRGEIGGEVLRGISMFRNFPATIIANHWARALRGFEGNTSSRIGYATAMLIGTWALGTAVVQLKEIAKGRKPVDWDNKELWKKGMLQGGSLSIVGDIMSSDSRAYGSIQDFALGPIGSDANKIIWKGILGNMDDMKNAEYEFSKHLKGAVGLSADYVPGQFWYTKLIMERMFLDSMRRFGDPNYDRKVMQRENKRRKEFQNERWFK